MINSFVRPLTVKYPSSLTDPRPPVLTPTAPPQPPRPRPPPTPPPLPPPAHGEVPVLAYRPQVSRTEPPIPVEDLSGGVGTSPISLEDVRPPHLDLPYLPGWQGLSALDAHHPRLLARERAANGAGSPLALVWVRQVHARLGHPIPL